VKRSGRRSEGAPSFELWGGCGTPAEPTDARTVGAVASKPPIIYQCGIKEGSAGFGARGSTNEVMGIK